MQRQSLREKTSCTGVPARSPRGLRYLIDAPDRRIGRCAQRRRHRDDSGQPGAGEANWPYAGFDQTGGDFLNYALYNEVSLGYCSTVGLLPQVAIDNQPIATQLNLNWWSYINNVLTDVTGAVPRAARSVTSRAAK